MVGVHARVAGLRYLETPATATLLEPAGFSFTTTLANMAGLRSLEAPARLLDPTGSCGFTSTLARMAGLTLLETPALLLAPAGYCVTPTLANMATDSYTCNGA